MHLQQLFSRIAEDIQRSLICLDILTLRSGDEDRIPGPFEDAAISLLALLQCFLRYLALGEFSNNLSLLLADPILESVDDLEDDIAYAKSKAYCDCPFNEAVHSRGLHHRE